MTREADRRSRDAAAALGLALPGDTALYVLLPLHAALYEVTLAEVGLLLAANRLVRIAGYGWVARSYERHGPRGVGIVAILAAAVSTLGYGLLTGVWALLVMRLIWGLAFAGLNIAAQALATAEADGASRRSGRSRAIVSIGPMASLIGGTLLAEWLGPRPVFIGFAAIALLALPLVMRLPAERGAAIAGGPRFALPSRLDIWSFVHGLTMDGLFVVGLTAVAVTVLPAGAGIAAGVMLSLRFLAEIVLGPPGGAAAERWGPARLLVLFTLGAAFGLALIGVAGWWDEAFWIGALMAVVLRGLLQPLPAPVAAILNPGAGRVAAIARLATWRDIGAGVGPMLAGLLLPLLDPVLLYGLAALLLALSALSVGRARAPVTSA
jgi:MFS family permease